MGSVFKKAVTRPLPPGAEIITRQGVRLARWRDGKGKVRTSPLTTGKAGTERIRDESSTYFARYRDGNNRVVEVPTECRDKTAAQSVLAGLERRAEKVRSKILTSAEDRIADHMMTPIGEHFDAYLNALAAAGSVPRHRQNVRIYLNRLADECRFKRLADLNREELERWLAAQAKKGRSARSRNSHRAAIIAFANWCADLTIGRLASNPFKGVPKADEKADPRRRRRSMTEAELVRLLDVARRRPLLEALTVRRGKGNGQAFANIRPEIRAQLEGLGRERALIYKTLVLTGLPKNELATLTVAQVRLHGPTPYIGLDAADEKNREGNDIIIRADLASDLRAWLRDKLAARQAEALRRGEPFPARLPSDSLVVVVPTALDKIFNRDLKAAGIAKRDERGRTLDVHALRTTFGTLLGRGGVPLRTAQAAMRHSDPKLTANVYTDPKLLDVQGALDALPSLRLDAGPTAELERARATGTDPCAVALPVALNNDKDTKSAGIGDKTKTESPVSSGPTRLAVSGQFSDDFAMIQGSAATGLSVCPTGVEPVTFSSGGQDTLLADYDVSPCPIAMCCDSRESHASPKWYRSLQLTTVSPRKMVCKMVASCSVGGARQLDAAHGRLYAPLTHRRVQGRGFHVEPAGPVLW
jgi:integrase